MKYAISVKQIYEVGHRDHQEDAMAPEYMAARDDSDRLFVLCDGMGGHDAGEVASATVCDTVMRTILGSNPDPEGQFTDAQLRDALIASFDALDSRDTGAERKMGTTMTFLKLHQKGATVAHIGDSRVYHIRPGKTADETRILFATRDHSLVAELVRAGEMTEAEARVSSRKNIITRAMQPHLNPRPAADLKHITDIEPGDYFYMCTDGMIEHMDDKQICYFFSEEGGDDDHKVGKLISATRHNQDNHSAFIIHILEVDGVKKEQPYVSDEALYQAAPADEASLPDVDMPAPAPHRGSGGLVTTPLRSATLSASEQAFVSTRGNALDRGSEDFLDLNIAAPAEPDSAGSEPPAQITINIDADAPEEAPSIEPEPQCSTTSLPLSPAATPAPPTAPAAPAPEPAYHQAPRQSHASPARKPESDGFDSLLDKLGNWKYAIIGVGALIAIVLIALIVMLLK